MRLSISNIGFSDSDTLTVYGEMKKNGFTALEIAPGAFIGNAPYDKCSEAAKKAQALKEEYGFGISSLQSIWYGQEGNIFVPEDAIFFEEYTAKCIEFAAALSCENIVLGCPKNRNMADGQTVADAISFFSKISKMAHERGTCIALEANPSMYGTNFCNTSAQAFAFAKEVPHLKVNYDLGTLLINGESLQILADNIDAVNHVHISEPSLGAIDTSGERKALHTELADLLKSGGYSGYVSVEMRAQPLDMTQRVLAHVAEVFGG